MEQIRKVTLGTDPQHCLNYVEGGDINIWIDGKPEKRKVCNVVEDSEFIYISIKSGTESQLWKRIPRSQAIVEFVVD